MEWAALPVAKCSKGEGDNTSKEEYFKGFCSQMRKTHKKINSNKGKNYFSLALCIQLFWMMFEVM